jgi:uncharacterized protein
VSDPGAGGLPEKLPELRSVALFDEDSSDCRLAGYLSLDAMCACLLIEIKKPDAQLDPDILSSKLRASGVVFGLDRELVEACIRATVDEPHPRPLEVARGRPPERGKDGRIEFYVRPTSDKPYYQADSAGRIDYHDLHLIENVAAEQEVACLLHATDGQVGTNVLGESVPAEPGEPIKYKCGNGVRLAANQTMLHAEVPGRLIYENDALEISQVYEVHGNVDFHVGNIDFVGRVLVHGEILDDFSVRAGMGLEISGPVGNCQLISGADVKLLSGMSGKMEGKIIAAGDVYARYLDGATIEAEGDVIVDREAVNSNIRTSGAYRSPGGAVIGGEVMAIRGIEVGKAGSSIGVATRLISGVDFQTALPAAQTKLELSDLESKMAHARSDLGDLLENPEKLRALPAEEKRTALNLISRLRVLSEKLGALLNRKGQSREHKTSLALLQVNVKVRAFPAVQVMLGPHPYSFAEDTDGPLSCAFDFNEKIVRIIPYQPLT